MSKRYRIKKPKPNTLELCYGRFCQGEDPEIGGAWGEGCSKRDLNLLFYYMTSPRPRWDTKKGWEHGPSLIEELESRGYDITTLKFSIKKLPPKENE